jgi:hypothetical protein
MVSIGIIALLVGIATPVYVRARQESRIMTCVSNLQSLSQANTFYVNQHNGLPPEDVPLSKSFAALVNDPKAFRCPDDDTEGPDSYSLLYAHRKRYESAGSYVVGCARHSHSRRGVNLFLDSTVRSSLNARVIHIDGGEKRVIYPGERISSGVIQMADGSEMVLGGDCLSVVLLQSFIAQNHLYHVFRVPVEGFGTLIATASPGAALDVVTVSANFHLNGGKITVETGLALDGSDRCHWSRVRSHVGVVTVTPKIKGAVRDLPEGGQRTIMGALYRPASE